MYGVTFLVKNHQRFSLKYSNFKTSASSGVPLLFLFSVNIGSLASTPATGYSYYTHYSFSFPILYFEMPTFPCFPMTLANIDKWKLAY